MDQGIRDKERLIAVIKSLNVKAVDVDVLTKLMSAAICWDMGIPEHRLFTSWSGTLTRIKESDQSPHVQELASQLLLHFEEGYDAWAKALSSSTLQST